VQQVAAQRFLAGLGPKRTATTVPAPLRYWQYRPAGPVAVGLTLLLVAAWLVVFGVLGGWSELREEVPLALVAGLAVLVLNTGRVTVSDHGLSSDVAGARSDPARVVPLVAVREVRRAPLPAAWARPERRGGRWPGRTRVGGRWPGRTRVGVRYADAGGGPDRSLTLWVRDPEAFAAALGRPLG
jgi:hypothetical protein